MILFSDFSFIMPTILLILLCLHAHVLLQYMPSIICLICQFVIIVSGDLIAGYYAERWRWEGLVVSVCWKVLVPVAQAHNIKWGSWSISEHKHVLIIFDTLPLSINIGVSLIITLCLLNRTIELQSMMLMNGLFLV